MEPRFLFEPASVAVIGASTDPSAVGHVILRNLIAGKFAGKLYPVNPKAPELLGLPCYPDIRDVPDTPELAVISLPAAMTPAVLAQAADKGVKAAIVVASGFKESGQADLEKTLAETARSRGIALLGPNCLGVLNPRLKLNASFASAHLPKKGGIAFCSQSGALCTAALDEARTAGLGFSAFVSFGNKAALDETDLLSYFAVDKRTKTIAFYIEDIQRPAEFLTAARKLRHARKWKPVIVLKSGRTMEGSAASASHTGSLAGGDAAYDALFAQAGILRAQSMGEMMQLLTLFNEAPPASGKRLAIVTNAGGPGVLATDTAATHGLELAKLSPETETLLKAALPPAAATHNPVDVLGDASAKRYAEALAAVGSDPNVDSLAVILTPQAMTDSAGTAAAVGALAKLTGKPVAAAFMGDKLVQPGTKILARKKVPRFRYPEEAVQALAAWTRGRGEGPRKETTFHFKKADTGPARSVFEGMRHSGKKTLPEAETVPLLAAYGFPVIPARVAHSPEAARDIASVMGDAPLVMKIVSPDILHKSDVGGVMLDVPPSEAMGSFNQLIKTVSEKAPEARLEGVLITSTAPKHGQELILGMKRDPLFGPVVMVGLGGIFVEVMQDVAFGVTPLTREDAHAMLSRLKGYPLLTGARGNRPADLDALIESIGRLAQFALDFPEVNEVEINPLLVLPEGEGLLALDARLSLL